MLVVDDDRAVLEVITEILESADFRVVTASNAMCSNLIRLHAPHVILMDVNMPGLKGDAVCKILVKHRELLGKAVIVLHSSTPQAELEHVAASCGADGAIEKGLPIQQFIDRIATWVDKVKSRL